MHVEIIRFQADSLSSKQHQSQGKVERLHKELAKTCENHEVAPDKAAHIYNSAFGGGEDVPAGAAQAAATTSSRRIKFGPAGTVRRQPPVFEGTENASNESAKTSWSLPVASGSRDHPPGQLVHLKKPERSRTKDEPWWERLHRVTEKVGKTKCNCHDGKSIRLCHRSRLKKFSLGESVLRGLIVNPLVIRKAVDKLGELPLDGKRIPNFSELPDRLSEDGSIWMGFPGRARLEDAVELLRGKAFSKAFLVVPELPCDRWHPELEEISSDWFGVEANDNCAFWVTRGEGLAFEPGVTWWIAKINGDH